MTHPSTSKPSTRQTDLITGASSGIGEALAHCFATAKMDLVLVARSEGKLRDLSQTLAAKHGVTVLNAPGTIDADYRGEIGVILINHGVQPFVIERGMRIAQMVIQTVCRAEVEITEELNHTARSAGGFGHTGHA